jgi:hypothetical protein
MTLPLQFTVQDDEVQANFDDIKKRFPISRRDLKLEAPHIVGASGEPGFLNSWVNYDAAVYQVVRFWRDPLDMIHVEGLVKNGVIGAGGTVFILPAGYRPSLGMLYSTETSTGHGRVDVSPTGNVIAVAGGNGYFSINIPPFRRAS